MNGYDRYGNRWVTTSGLDTDPNRPAAASNFEAATNRLNGSNPDPAGNQQTLAPFTLAYDGEGRMVRAESAGLGQSEKSEYDGAGRRVKRVVCPQKASGCEATDTGARATYFLYDMQGQLATEEGPAMT